jgi:hypothetical protein
VKTITVDCSHSFITFKPFSRILRPKEQNAFYCECLSSGLLFFLSLLFLLLLLLFHDVFIVVVVVFVDIDVDHSVVAHDIVSDQVSFVVVTIIIVTCDKM